MAEDFLLKWNDHHSLFFSGAERLLREEEFTDVTLAAESKVFRAHKFVLSICSPYFQVVITSYFTLHLLTKKLSQGLFRRLGPDKHVIFLKDIRAAHLELLLQYMYQGEIKVQEAELVTVLNVAQSLEIKGLTDSTESKQQQGVKRRTPSPSPAPAPVMKKPRPVEQHPPPPRPQQQQHLPQQQPYVQSSVSVKQEVAPVIDIDQVYFQLSW